MKIYFCKMTLEIFSWAFYVKVFLNMVYVNSFKEIKSSVSFVVWKVCFTSALIMSRDFFIRTYSLIYVASRTRRFSVIVLFQQY